jgi:putative endonuclease
MSSRAGRDGESKAVDYLVSNGYEIIARNYWTRGGEIDIVASKEGRISFIEVKSWKVYGMEDLEYSVGRRKQKRIVAASRKFLSERSIDETNKIGFDLLFIDTGVDTVTYLQDVFNETGIL